MDSLRQSRPVTRIREDILRQITEGQLQPGDAVMTIDELSRRYEVARETVRGVIQQLVKEGHLSSQRGKGTFVRERSARRGKTPVRLTLAVLNSEGFAGVKRAIGKFNRSSADVTVEVASDGRPTGTPEVLLTGSYGKIPETYRLDVFRGYEDLADSLHPRFWSPDIGRSGEEIANGSPFAWCSRCLAINRDAARGIPVDDFPATWDEALSWAEEGKKMRGLTSGTLLSLESTGGVLGRYLPFYWMAGGGDLYDPDSQKLRVDRKAFVRWLEFFGELAKCSQVYRTSVEPDPLLSGEFLFDPVAGPWLIKQAREVGSAVGYSLHPAPTPRKGGESVAALSFLRLGIPRKDLNESQKAACWSVIRYLLSPEVQAGILDGLSLLPVRRDLLEGLDSADPVSAFEGLLACSRVLRGDAVSKKLRGALSLEFYNFLTGHRDARKSLDSFEQTAKAIVALEAGVNEEMEYAIQET